jgi:hypothetical protein
MLGRAAAQQCYLEALRLDMLYAPAWRGLGDLLRESGELVQVRCVLNVKLIVDCLRQQLLLCLCLLLHSLGDLLREIGELVQVVDAFTCHRCVRPPLTRACFVAGAVVLPGGCAPAAVLR